MVAAMQNCELSRLGALFAKDIEMHLYSVASNSSGVEFIKGHTVSTIRLVGNSNLDVLCTFCMISVMQLSKSCIFASRSRETCLCVIHVECF